MTLLLRTLSRLVGMLLMLVLALAGLALALYCLDGVFGLGSARPDRLLGLVSVRNRVGRFLDQLGVSGPTARLALLCGLAAMLLGVLLVVGTVRRRRSRVAILDTVGGGTLAARPRPLRAIARALAERADGATAVTRPKLALSRRGRGGRLTVRASRARTSEENEVRSEIASRLEPVTEPFGLRPRIRVRIGEAGERVQ
jgi:hypothetical protein